MIEDLEDGSYYSPQERFVHGDDDKTDKDTPNWRIPKGISNRELSIEEVDKTRRHFGGFCSLIPGLILGLGRPVYIKFANLSEQTGETLEDPIIIGRVRKDKKGYDKFTRKEAKEITKRYVEKMRELGYDPKYKKY